MTAGPTLTVAHVSTARAWYGGEQLAYILIRGMRKAGHRCVTFARSGGEFARRLRDEGFEVEAIPGNGRGPLAMLKTRRHLARLRPDVVHFQDSHAISGAGVAAIGLGIGARVAARRFHGRARGAKYRWLCDVVVADSEAVARTLRDGGVPPERIRVIYDAVDPQRVCSGSRARGRKALGLAEDEPLLVTVASLEPVKGHTDLLDALPTVLARHDRAQAAFVGDGSLREPLEAQARARGIAGRVRFLGYRKDVPDLLHAADLFVFPSRNEAMGTSLIDAMLAGVPIVTTTAGGIPEVVGERGDDPAVAWLVPAEQPEALAAAIDEALGSGLRARSLTERARLRALDLFTADTMVEKTVDLYRDLLARSGRV